MRQDVQEWSRACEVCCARNGSGRRIRAPLKLYQVGAPLELMVVDIVGPIPITARGNRFICVTMDYFSKWPEAYALPTMRLRLWLRRFGVAQELHSGDQEDSHLPAEAPVGWYGGTLQQNVDARGGQVLQ